MSLRTIFSVVLLSVFTSLGTTFLASKFSSGDNSLTSIQVSQLDLASMQERINELAQDRRVSASAGQLQQPNLNSPSPALLVRGQTDIEGEVEGFVKNNMNLKYVFMIPAIMR